MDWRTRSPRERNQKRKGYGVDRRNFRKTRKVLRHGPSRYRTKKLEDMNTTAAVAAVAAQRQRELKKEREVQRKLERESRAREQAERIEREIEYKQQQQRAQEIQRKVKEKWDRERPERERLKREREKAAAKEAKKNENNDRSNYAGRRWQMEADPMYTHKYAGRAQRQEHVKTLNDGDYRKLTQKNLATPHTGEDGNYVFRDSKMTARVKYPGLWRTTAVNLNALEQDQLHRNPPRMTAAQTRLYKGQEKRWNKTVDSVDQFVGGKRRLKYPRAKGNLFYMNKKSRGRRITMRLVHKHPEAFKGSEFRHFLRPRSLTRKKKRSLLRKKKRILLRKKKRSHSRRTRKVMRSRVHQSRKRRTRRK